MGLYPCKQAQYSKMHSRVWMLILPLPPLPTFRLPQGFREGWDIATSGCSSYWGCFALAAMFPSSLAPANLWSIRWKTRPGRET